MFTNRFSSRSILFTLLLALLASTGLAGCNPEKVASLATKIADFEAPQGYSPEFGMAANDYIVVSYRGPDRPSHLYLIQSRNDADGEELENLLTQAIPGSSDRRARMIVIESHLVTIRGQEVTVVISEGVNSDDATYREATTIFHGKGGPALLVLSDSTERWNQESVDAWLESIQ